MRNLVIISYPTAKYSALVASLLLVTSCGDTPSGGKNINPTHNPNPSSPYGQSTLELSSLAKNYVALTYNGFSGEANQYNDNATTNIIKDLSASNPANLYLLSLYVDAVGTHEKPSTTSLRSYDITLASGLEIKTGLTLLNPKLAMNNQRSSFQGEVIPSATNPVILTIPAGLKDIPETPFFPRGTRYTAVLAESQTTAKDKHSAIFSIETSTTEPVVFGAFAHTSGSPLNLRFYDNKSTIDASSQGDAIPLLSKTAQSGVIQARFLSLVADNLPKMSLESMNQATFGELGMGSHQLVSLLHSAFPSLVEEKKQNTEIMRHPIFNAEHGIFCLGGNNQFDTVNLAHQTFIYPQSSSEKNTRIETVNVSADSGFITESGKHINITKLNGDRTLKLIAVIKEALEEKPIIQVEDLNGVNKVNVVIGKVGDTFTLPARGMVLLSYGNTNPTIETATEDAHMGGALYDGETEIKNNQVILTKLIKRTASMGAGTIHRLLSCHPNTQGISGQELGRLTLALDPLKGVSYHAGSLSAAHMNHHSMHLQRPIVNRINMSASNMLNHTVISSNLNYQVHGFGVMASVYGIASDKRETSFGSALTGFKNIAISQGVITPSITVGYSSNHLNDIELSAEKVQVSLRDIALNSVFARLVTTFKHIGHDLTTSIAAGLEARHGIFSHGNAFSNHTQISIKGDNLNTLHSIIEATFSAESVQFKAALWNFNQFELTFGLSR